MEGGGRREKQRAACEGVGLMLLALTTEERPRVSQREQAASRSWERQGKGFSPQSPDDLLILPGEIHFRLLTCGTLR